MVLNRMKKITKDKIVKNLKIFFIILIMILLVFSQISGTRHSSNKLSPKDAWLLIIYIFGITVIPLVAYCVCKLKEK